MAFGGLKKKPNILIMIGAGFERNWSRRVEFDFLCKEPYGAEIGGMRKMIERK